MSKGSLTAQTAAISKGQVAIPSTGQAKPLQVKSDVTKTSPSDTPEALINFRPATAPDTAPTLG